MNNDEMVLTINIRYLLTRNARETALLGVIKNRVNDMDTLIKHNCEPFVGCPCKCPITLSCTHCWEKAVETFLEGDNKPCI
jgi:hypothetical protein